MDALSMIGTRSRGVWLLVLSIAALSGGGLGAAIDQNLDGKVDVIDVQATINAIISPLPPPFPGYCDPNRDNVVDIADVQLLVNVILGIPLPLTIATPTKLRSGGPGMPYRCRLEAFGGVGELAWAYSGNLPPGCTFSSDGAIEGVIPVQNNYTFQAAVSDSLGTVVQDFTIPLDLLNLAPYANHDRYKVTPGVTLSVAAPGVLFNDSDPNGDQLSVVLVTNVSHGVLALAPNGGFSFAPATNTPLTLTFVYRTVDVFGLSSLATVTLGIGNLAPDTIPDLHQVPRNGVLTVAAPGVLQNDSDIDLDILSVELDRIPGHGTVELSPDGGFIYTPDLGYAGGDCFGYIAKDGNGGFTPGLCVISVVSYSAPALLDIRLSTSPSPVRAGYPVTYTALVTDFTASNPGPANLASVSLLPDQQGIADAVALRLVAQYGLHQSLWSVTTTVGHGYGIHTITGRVTTTTNQTAETSVRMAVYVSSPRIVGPGYTYPTIQSAINACTPNSAILLSPGTYAGAGNRDLTVPGTVILASQYGRASAVIDCGGIGSAFIPAGLGQDCIIMGITVKNAGDSGVQTIGSPTFFRATFSQCFSPGSGGAIAVLPWGQPRVFECLFNGNSCGTLGTPQAGRGGAICLTMGGPIELHQCCFIQNSAKGARDALGAAVYIDCPSAHVNIIQGCTFLRNSTECGADAYGGAVYLRGGGAEISHSRFVGNEASAHSTTVSGTPPETRTGHGGRGGAVALNQDAAVNVFNSQFRMNRATGGTCGEGGAFWLQYCCQLVLDQCHLDANSARQTNMQGWTKGGVFFVSSMSSLRCENSLITNSRLDCMAGAYGGVLHSGSGWDLVPMTWYLGFHNCLVVGTLCNSRNGGNPQGNVACVDDIPMSTNRPVVYWENCTISDNTGGYYCMRLHRGDLTLLNCNIFRNNGHVISRWGPGVLNVTTTNMHPVLMPPYDTSPGGNISLDPMFATNPEFGPYFLSQPTGQAFWSPCVNTGSFGPGTAQYMDYTTSTALITEVGNIDMGWHMIPDSMPRLWRAGMTAAQLRTAYGCNPPPSPPPPPPSPPVLEIVAAPVSVAEPSGATGGGGSNGSSGNTRPSGPEPAPAPGSAPRAPG